MSSLEKAHRLFAPRIAYLIGTHAPDGISNIIPISNVTPISTNPQQIVLAVYKEWDTHQNLLGSEGFTLSVPHIDHLEGVWKLGAKYSRYPYATKEEKIMDSGLTIDYGASKYGPVLADGIGWITFRTLKNLDFGGDHTLFVAQAENAYFNPEYLNPDGTPHPYAHPVMQVTGNTFTTSNEIRDIPYYN